MSKTAEEILKDAAVKDLQDMGLPVSWADANVKAIMTQDKRNTYSFVLPAMHTYAQEIAVEFAEWCDASQYNYIGKGTWLGFDNVQYTTYGLYTIYLNQQNKK